MTYDYTIYEDYVVIRQIFPGEDPVYIIIDLDRFKEINLSAPITRTAYNNIRYSETFKTLEINNTQISYIVGERPSLFAVLAHINGK